MQRRHIAQVGTNLVETTFMYTVAGDGAENVGSAITETAKRGKYEIPERVDRGSKRQRCL